MVAAILLLAMVPTFIGRATCIADGGGQPGSSDWCYTEIARLAITEGVIDGRLPYIDECPKEPTTPCDEYPPLTMYPMWLAANIGGSPLGTFGVASVLLIAAAAVVTWCLWRLVGRRALFFAAAPTLFLYGPMNWDLLGVAFMTIGVFLFLRGRMRAAGASIGLGVAAKVMPGIAGAPMAFVRSRSGRIQIAWGFVVAALVAWIVVNAPFALTALHGWSELFRFNAARPVDVDSLWSVGCHVITGHTPCSTSSLIDPLSATLFAVVILIVWRLRSRADPTTDPWTMGFATLSVFFLTNKVYSPQYDLFLLPWFALVLPDIRLFAAFELADTAIFVTRYRGVLEPSLDLFHIAVLARAIVLVVALDVYVRARWVAAEPSQEDRSLPSVRPASGSSMLAVPDA